MDEREQFELDMREEIHRFPMMMLAEYLKRGIGEDEVGPLAGLMLGLAVARKSPATAAAMLGVQSDPRLEETMSDLADDVIVNWAKWGRFSMDVQRGETIDALYTLAKSLGRL